MQHITRTMLALALTGALLRSGATEFWPARRRPRQTANAPANATRWTLDSVLTELDRVAPTIKSVVADVQSSKYTKVVDDTTTETGQLFYRKARSSPELSLDLVKPAEKLFIYRNNTGWMYQRSLNQVQKFDLSRNKSLVEQFFLLGMGSGGHSLLRSFNVRYEGAEVVNGSRMPKLLLIPRDPQFAHNVTSIELWFDPQSWIAAQQKFNQPSGDYQRLLYGNARINVRISGSHFNTAFPGATVVTPHA